MMHSGRVGARRRGRPTWGFGEFGEKRRVEVFVGVEHVFHATSEARGLCSDKSD
jgi:hypothetical protein